MKRLTTLAVSFLMIPLFFASAWAAAPQWEFDPAHGEILFKIKHILGLVSGHFEKYNGVVRFDPQDLPGSSIEVTIEVKSINTRVEKRDAHLLTDDFFSADTYPVMTFVSTEITAKDNNRYAAKGKLTIKDVTKEITLPFTHLGTVEHPMDPGKLVAGFVGYLTIDRLEFHVGDGKFFRQGLVGKDVDLHLYFELLRDK